MATPAGSEQSHSAQSMSSTPEVEKDEFGRDLRPQSPKIADSNPSRLDAGPTQPPQSQIPSSVSPTVVPQSDEGSVERHEAPQNADMQLSHAHESTSNSSDYGLNKIDLGTCDFTSPTAWEALGKMWQASCGYMPSQEELIQFVVASRSTETGTVASQPLMNQPWPNSGWSNTNFGVTRGQPWRGRGRGSTGYTRGGRGSYGHSHEQWGYMTTGYASNASDAIVLGGTEDNANQESNEEGKSNQENGQEDTQSRTGGRMQRVGDKWIFVRDPAGGVS